MPAHAGAPTSGGAQPNVDVCFLDCESWDARMPARLRFNRIATQGECDFVEDIAVPLPLSRDVKISAIRGQEVFRTSVFCSPSSV